jgi:hypothetical protein
MKAGDMSIATEVMLSAEPLWLRCILEVRLPRVTLPDNGVALVEPDWFGKLSGFTLLFEAFVLKLAQHTDVPRACATTQAALSATTLLRRQSSLHLFRRQTQPTDARALAHK